MFYFSISPSQQIHNACKYGDTEADHCRAVALRVFQNLDQDQRFQAYLIPKIDSRLQSGNKYLAEVVKLSDNFTKKTVRENRFHIDIHTDATGADKVARGTTTFFYSKGSKSEKLARAVHAEVIKISGKGRGISARPGLAIMGVNSTSILVELDFHDNIAGANCIHGHIKNFADAITIGIYKYFDLDRPKVKHYSLQLGYYSEIKHAEEKQKELKKKGIDCVIKVV